MALPWASVMVTMVLLKLASTCATPAAMFLRSFLRGAREAPPRGSRAILLRHLLLAGDRHRLALARARVGVGALAAHRQAAAVPQAAVAGHVHQPLDVHGDLAPEVALDPVLAVDQLADAEHLFVGELVHAPLARDAELVADVLRVLRTDAVDVAQRNRHALVGWDVHAGNASHFTAPARAGRPL